MLQVEAEREMLSSGRSVLERARDWYDAQMAQVNEKMKDLARHSSAAQWVSYKSLSR